MPDNGPVEPTVQYYDLATHDEACIFVLSETDGETPEDEDMFVTPLRRRPGSVVLLEDIDKGHARVLDRLLRVFDEGEIAGKKIQKLLYIVLVPLVSTYFLPI